MAELINSFTNSADLSYRKYSLADVDHSITDEIWRPEVIPDTGSPEGLIEIESVFPRDRNENKSSEIVLHEHFFLYLSAINQISNNCTSKVSQN